MPSVDLKLTYENIQRRFSCSSKRPTWTALSNQIKSRFGLADVFNLGLSYIDDDGEVVVLSSDKELEHVWPVISEFEETGLDSLPPLRFKIVQLPTSHSIKSGSAAGAADKLDSATPSGRSVETNLDDDEDEMVDEVASGISDIEIIDAQEHDGDKKKKKHKKEKEPKKKTTLQEDIRSFIETVKGAVEDNDEIHKAFHKIISHIHDKPSKDGHNGKEGDGATGITALGILTEETGKMDAVTAGIVSALLAPALMGPPGFPPPPPPPGHGHGRRRGPHGPPHPPFPPHFGAGRPGRHVDMPPPPPPPPGFPPHHPGHFERGPHGRPPFPPFPPHFFHHGSDFDFGRGGASKRRGCPYGMPPPHFAPHMMHEAPFGGRKHGFSHHAPPPFMFGPGGSSGDHAPFDGSTFGPHRHHGRYASGHGQPSFSHGPPPFPPLGRFYKHHMKNWEQEVDDLPAHFGSMHTGAEAMEGDLPDSDSDTSSTTSSSSSDEEVPSFGRGQHARFGGGMFGPPGHGFHGPPPPRGPSRELERHHGRHGRHGGPGHGDMPPPPPPFGRPGHAHGGRTHGKPQHHHRRWA
ncbi:hypothetical protein P389DRAFT_195145 [Cystobasidium minutum MCA 4210]|uniref:uncharacterized protein n=1 Tax=Cystobasidium minutum MCA 4210 TaxID=1397322 RepID=UPI0034CEDFA6|eukprot:jgi/Rhomi1/195145/gm1.3359_g